MGLDVAGVGRQQLLVPRVAGRRPGAVVDTRTGYTAGIDARSMNAYASLRRLTIDNALAAPFGFETVYSPWVSPTRCTMPVEGDFHRNRT